MPLKGAPLIRITSKRAPLVDPQEIARGLGASYARRHRGVGGSPAARLALKARLASERPPRFILDDSDISTLDEIRRRLPKQLADVSTGEVLVALVHTQMTALHETPSLLEGLVARLAETLGEAPAAQETGERSGSGFLRSLLHRRR